MREYVFVVVIATICALALQWGAAIAPTPAGSAAPSRAMPAG